MSNKYFCEVFFYDLNHSSLALLTCFVLPLLWLLGEMLSLKTRDWLSLTFRGTWYISGMASWCACWRLWATTLAHRLKGWHGTAAVVDY